MTESESLILKELEALIAKQQAAGRVSRGVFVLLCVIFSVSVLDGNHPKIIIIIGDISPASKMH